jgi:7-cyano-7-deazaguanine synthase
MAKSEGSSPVDDFDQPSRDPASLAILVSGGLDSAILLGEALSQHPVVHPVYIRSGLAWEAEEQQHLRHFLDAVASPALRPLTVLELTVKDLYGDHWSLTGSEVPGAHTPDDAVYLPGRNVLLLAKALIWCHLHGVSDLAIGVLQSNPFRDATPKFFTDFQAVVNEAVGGTVRIRRPYAGMNKREIMRRARGLPLTLTFSCINPAGGNHCGRCNKCAERREAFAAAGIRDATSYAEN